MAYNGWSNYETWNVKLWMDNDEGSYRYWQEQTLEVWEQTDHDKDETVRKLADMIESEHQEAMPELSGTFSDLLGAALSEVDWHEIAESLMSDAELTEDEEAEADNAQR